MATVKLHRAALAAVHKAAGHNGLPDNEAVRQIMKGIARAHGKPRKRARPLTAEALSAVKATAGSQRSLGGPGNRQESAERAVWRARVDVALLATLRDGILRRWEAANRTWSDIEFRDDGALLDLWRGHWVIENRVFRVRVVTMDEDRSQVRTGSAPQIMAGLRSLVISLLRMEKEPNFGAALRRCATRPSRSLSLLGAPVQ